MYTLCCSIFTLRNYRIFLCLTNQPSGLFWLQVIITILCQACINNYIEQYGFFFLTMLPNPSVEYFVNILITVLSNHHTVRKWCLDSHGLTFRISTSLTTDSPGDLQDLWEMCLSTAQPVTVEMICVCVCEGEKGGRKGAALECAFSPLTLWLHTSQSRPMKWFSKHI